MTSIGAAEVHNGKVVNMLIVDTSDGVTVNGYVPAEGTEVHILPFGSQATFGWDYRNGQFYSPLPETLTIIRGTSIQIPYALTAQLPTGVTFSNSTLTVSNDATPGTFNATLKDQATSRTVACVITVTSPTA